MGADRDALTTAVMQLHAAVDGWAAAVVAAAEAHPGDPDAASESLPLGVAEDTWDDALDAFYEAAATVMGVEDDEPEDVAPRDPGETVGVQLYATVVGSGDGDPVVLVDAAGEQVVARLEAAGYEVPEWGVSIVPVQELASLDAAEEDE